jgi:hypothetical protein
MRQEKQNFSVPLQHQVLWKPVQLFMRWNTGSDGRTDVNALDIIHLFYEEK